MTMVLAYAVCAVSVAPVRAEGTHRSEQVSQLLFGERVEVLAKGKNNWLHIRCEWDDYEGWVKEGQIALISYQEYRKTLQAYACGSINPVQVEDGQFFVSPGSSLFRMKKGIMQWQNRHFRFKGKKIALKAIAPAPSEIERISKMFIGTPYLWGGRSIMGIDCSGFTQVVFKLQNIALPRDAAQQAETGESIGFLQEARCGDLAFFDNDEGYINHVGILLNEHTIIHATDTSGCVVIDAIDNGGIISRRLRMRTHKLRLLKRILR